MGADYYVGQGTYSIQNFKVLACKAFSQGSKKDARISEWTEVWELRNLLTAGSFYLYLFFVFSSLLSILILLSYLSIIS